MIPRRLIPIILASVALAAPLHAQEEKIVTLPENGPDFFSHLLFSEKLTPLTSFQQAEADPGDSMILILGTVRWQNVLRFTKDGMKPFLKNGGTLFIATDQNIILGGPLGITVADERIESREEKGYRHSKFCPWLEYAMPLADGPRDAREHPVFHLLQQGIATNCPSHINRDDHNTPLARLLFFPPRRGEYGERPLLTYVIGSPKDAPPAGRVLVVAGYGTFMNSMMLQKDNDNFAFALNCVRWLRAKSAGMKRAKALFVVDGAIITKFDRNLAPPLPPLPVPPAAMINRLLRGMEDEGLFHKAFALLLGDFADRVVPFLIALATCGLLVYGGKKFMEGRHLRETAVPRMVGPLPAVAEAPPRGEQRQHALSRDGDPWQAARALSEQWLQSEFGVTPEDWAGAGGAAEFRVAGLLGSGWMMRRRAERVLEILRSAGPTKIGRGDFALLVRTLPNLSRAAQAGRLTLLLDGKEVSCPSKK